VPAPSAILGRAWRGLPPPGVQSGIGAPPSSLEESQARAARIRALNLPQQHIGLVPRPGWVSGVDDEVSADLRGPRIRPSREPGLQRSGSSARSNVLSVPGCMQKNMRFFRHVDVHQCGLVGRESVGLSSGPGFFSVSNAGKELSIACLVDSRFAISKAIWMTGLAFRQFLNLCLGFRALYSGFDHACVSRSRRLQPPAGTTPPSPPPILLRPPL
jgi:hypothetical protein